MHESGHVRLVLSVACDPAQGDAARLWGQHPRRWCHTSGEDRPASNKGGDSPALSCHECETVIDIFCCTFRECDFQFRDLSMCNLKISVLITYSSLCPGKASMTGEGSGFFEILRKMSLKILKVNHL